MTALCKQHWLVHAHAHFVFSINLKSINDTLIQSQDCSFYSMNHKSNFEKFLILKSLGNVSQAYCEGGRGVRHNVRGCSGGDGWGVQQQVRGGHTMHSGKVICAFMHSELYFDKRLIHNALKVWNPKQDSVGIQIVPTNRYSHFGGLTSGKCIHNTN